MPNAKKLRQKKRKRCAYIKIIGFHQRKGVPISFHDMCP